MQHLEPTRARLLALLAGLSVCACAVGTQVMDQNEAWAGEAEPVVAAHLKAKDTDSLPARLLQCDGLTPVDAAWLSVAPPEPVALPEVSASLEPRVAFWARVWGEQSEQEVSIVDGYRPWLVWATVDCRTLGADDGVVDEATRAAGCGAAITSAMKSARARLATFGDDVSAVYADEAEAAAASERLMGVRGRREALDRGWERARDELFQVESLFALEGVPPTLARAAFVESLWRTDAVSRSGAVGAFQFVKRTAEEWLRVDDAIDERLDLRRQALAAARYTKRLKRQLGSWPLALTAYNTGPARLKRVMRDRESDDLGVVASFGNHRGFGFDGQNYYSQIAAIIRVTATWRPRPHLPLGQTLVVDQAARFKDVAACVGVDADVLASANPAVLPAVQSGDALLPQDYVLFVPAEEGTRMVATRLLPSAEL